MKDISLDDVDKAFGKVDDVIEPDALPEEFGFITGKMTQGEYKERVKALGENVLGMIRVKDWEDSCVCTRRHSDRQNWQRDREKDADKIGMLKIFGAKKKSDQNESREVSKANIRLEVLDPKEEKILESDSRIAYTGTWYQVTDKKESDHGTETVSYTHLTLPTIA